MLESELILAPNGLRRGIRHEFGKLLCRLRLDDARAALSGRSSSELATGGISAKQTIGYVLFADEGLLPAQQLRLLKLHGVCLAGA